jgi:hypothetical protein
MYFIDFHVFNYRIHRDKTQRRGAGEEKNRIVRVSDVQDSIITIFVFSLRLTDSPPLRLSKCITLILAFEIHV